MIKHIAIAVMAVVICGGALVAQGPAVIEPGGVYRWNGLTIVSPDQAGWALAGSDGSQIVFEKQNDMEVLRASVSFLKTEVFETDKDLLAGLEALKQEEFKTLEVDHLHFNALGGKGGPFLRYDGIFNLDDAARPGFRYLNLRGQLCRHPLTKGLAVQVEFSSRSNVRAFSEDLSSLADEFIEKIMLPKTPAKPV